MHVSKTSTHSKQCMFNTDINGMHIIKRLTLDIEKPCKFSISGRGRVKITSQ